MRKLEIYRMKDGHTPLSEAYFNPIWIDIDSRLDTLENLQASWEEATRLVSSFGISRIEELIRPAYLYMNEKRNEATEIVEELQELREQADEMINEKRDDAIQTVLNAKTDTLGAISNAKTDALGAISDAKTDALSAISQALQSIRAMMFFFGGD